MYLFVGSLLQTEVRLGHFNSENGAVWNSTVIKREQCSRKLQSTNPNPKIRVHSMITGGIISAWISEGGAGWRFVMTIALWNY